MVMMMEKKNRGKVKEEVLIKYRGRTAIIRYVGNLLLLFFFYHHHYILINILVAVIGITFSLRSR